MEQPNMPFHLQVTLPMQKACSQSSTGGVWVSNGLAQYAIPFVSHTPHAEGLQSIYHRGVWVSNGVAQYAIPFASHTPPVKGK